MRYTHTNENTLSRFDHIKVIDGGHIYFFGDNYGFSSTQESINYSLQYELSDFIINQEDANGDGLFNFDDVNMLVDHLYQASPFNISYDFNSDQNISIFDVLILSDFIF